MPNKCYCYIVAWVVSCPVAAIVVVVAVSSLHIYDAIDPLPVSPLFVRFSKKKNKSKSAKISLNFKPKRAAAEQIVQC